MTRVLLVSGNLRDGSPHTAALHTAVRVAPGELTASVYDGLRTLPAFVPGEQPPPGAVAFLRHRIDAADAVLFCTPEYAGALPGSLKNLLDWLVDGGALDGKPVAWLSIAAAGQDDGARAELETVLAHGNARVLWPACIRVPVRPTSVVADGLVPDPQLRRALLDMFQVLVRALADRPRPQPSWQAYSSVYPVVQRPGRAGA